MSNFVHQIVNLPTYEVEMSMQQKAQNCGLESERERRWPVDGPVDSPNSGPADSPVNVPGTSNMRSFTLVACDSGRFQGD